MLVFNLSKPIKVADLSQSINIEWRTCDRNWEQFS